LADALGDFAAHTRSKTGIRNHRRQRITNVKSAAPSYFFSTTDDRKILAAETNHRPKNHPPKTTHLITISEPSERPFKTVPPSQTATIDRPESCQR